MPPFPALYFKVIPLTLKKVKKVVPNPIFLEQENIGAWVGSDPILKFLKTSLIHIPNQKYYKLNNIV